MTTIASQITSLTVVYSIVYSGADQRKHQSSASLAFVNSPHKGPVTRKMFSIDDIIMLPTNLVKSWIREIGSYNDRIALKCDGRLDSSAAEVPVKAII